MNIIKEVLDELKADFNGRNEIFLSESDLQFSFAQKLDKILRKNHKIEKPEIILEYPIMAKTLCKNKEEFYKEYLKEEYETCRTFIDLYFKKDDTEYYIEFKYKLIEIPTAEITRYNCKDKFLVKNQGAQNNGHYQVYKDIERMENMKLIKPNCKAFVIFITNDSIYWEQDGKNTKYENFPLINGQTKRGKLKYYDKELLINSHYSIKWEDEMFKKIEYVNTNYKNKRGKEKGKFKSLVIDLNLQKN